MLTVSIDLGHIYAKTRRFIRGRLSIIRLKNVLFNFRRRAELPKRPSEAEGRSAIIGSGIDCLAVSHFRCLSLGFLVSGCMSRVEICYASFFAWKCLFHLSVFIFKSLCPLPVLTRVIGRVQNPFMMSARSVPPNQYGKENRSPYQDT